MTLRNRPSLLIKQHSHWLKTRAKNVNSWRELSKLFADAYPSKTSIDVLAVAIKNFCKKKSIAPGIEKQKKTFKGDAERQRLKNKIMTELEPKLEDRLRLAELNFQGRKTRKWKPDAHTLRNAFAQFLKVAEEYLDNNELMQVAKVLEKALYRSKLLAQHQCKRVGPNKFKPGKEYAKTRAWKRFVLRFSRKFKKWPEVDYYFSRKYFYLNLYLEELTKQGHFLRLKINAPYRRTRIATAEETARLL